MMESVAHGPKLPFVLASICKSWRKLACNRRMLWAKILAIQKLSERGVNQYLTLCLTRSRPLSLSIDAQHAEADVLSILQREIRRWGHLSCHKSNYVAVTDILRRHHAIPTNCLTSLKSVNLNFGVTDHLKDTRRPNPGYEQLWPALESLSITCRTPSNYFHLMPPSLTELKLRCQILSTKMLFDILSTCPTLLSIDLMVLKVHLSPKTRSSVSNPSVLNLKRLTIAAGKILGLIVPFASSLISVVLTPSNLVKEPIFPTPETMFVSNLKSLTIYVSSEMPNDRMLELVKLLGFLPALEYLVVRGSREDPIFVNVASLFGWINNAVHNDILRSLVELELRFVDLRSSFGNLLQVAERMVNFTDHRDKKPKIIFMGCLGTEQYAGNTLEKIIAVDYLAVER